MARKKEFMEQENPSMKENNSMDEAVTEAGGFPGEGEDGTPTESDGDGMDLNELLGSMDQEPSEESDMGEEILPELTEEEMFGESPEDADYSDETSPESVSSPEASDPPAKTRRATRRKKNETSEETDEGTQKKETETPDTTKAIPDSVSSAQGELAEDAAEEMERSIPQEDTSGTAAPATVSPRHTAARVRKEDAPVLTLEVRGEVETEESREDAIWHEIHNAYRTRRILTGQLGGIEQTDNGKTITIVDYKGFRIVIPLKEMMINIGRSPSGQEYTELMLRQNKILGNMLGAEIDFIVKGIDSKSRSVVASRKEAMLRKRQIFYLDTDAAGMYRIYEGRIAQARVIAVAEKVIRVEVFGVECSIMARDLAWEWIGDAHERFSVGDQVLVRILNVRRDSLEDMGIRADIKSVSQNTNHDNLKKCRIQSKYAGKVTDVHKGVVYIRLSNGVNAVAHSCYDYRTPGKKDDVSFAVTRIDEERGVAVGIITRIIRQNL